MQERLKLDLSQKTSVSQGITTRVNDGGVHSIDVTALNYGDVFDLTGYKVIFELTTSAKTIAFDPVNTKITDAKNGEFTYTIPKDITGVAGIAERAYFAFEKGNNRITSADISMTILQIIDITAEEAKTYISEYNKLVDELKALQDKAIKEMNANLAETNKQIAAVESKLKTLEVSIADYQKTVKDTADEAVKKIEDALEEINSKDSYSKDESDKKFVPKTQLATETEAGIVKISDHTTDGRSVALSSFGGQAIEKQLTTKADADKVIANKGDLAVGTDLNDVKVTGFYRLGALVGGTDILNTPSELSGIRFYAFLTVTGSLQELTVYSPKQDTTWTYSRSVSGTSQTWSNWSKAVMADDSGKVTIKDLVVTATVKTVNLEITGQSTKTVSIYNGGGQIILTRIGPMVQADIRSMPAIPANTTVSGVIPDGYKPAADYTSITHSNNRLIFYANGSIKPDNNAMVPDNGYYSCSWVTKDATPTT